MKNLREKAIVHEISRLPLNCAKINTDSPSEEAL